jgi:uncharacterized damage-inducible protein DinB
MSAMESSLAVAFRHNSWANLRLLEFLASIDEAHLSAGGEAVYGSVLSTLQHAVGSEGFYYSSFGAELPGWGQPDDVPATLEQINFWAADMATRWEELLSRPIDAETWLEQKRADGSIRRMQAGVVLAQALHHSNVHREQVSHILTVLGVEVPDISGWRFGYDSGLIEVRRTESL